MDSIFTCLDTALELELRALPYPSAVVAHRVGRAEASLARMREAYQTKLRDIMQQLSATPLETVAEEEPSSPEMECFETPPTFLTPSSTPTRKRKRRCSRVIAPMRITTEFIPPPSSEAARAERAARRQW